MYKMDYLTNQMIIITTSSISNTTQEHLVQRLATIEQLCNANRSPNKFDMHCPVEAS